MASTVCNIMIFQRVRSCNYIMKLASTGPARAAHEIAVAHCLQLTALEVDKAFLQSDLYVTWPLSVGWISHRSEIRHVDYVICTSLFGIQLLLQHERSLLFLPLFPILPLQGYKHQPRAKPRHCQRPCQGATGCGAGRVGADQEPPRGSCLNRSEHACMHASLKCKGNQRLLLLMCCNVIHPARFAVRTA